MRARRADAEGIVEHDGVKIHYEVYGDAGPTILLLPTWTIVHKRLWKAQLGYLARHCRVVTYDGPGNGQSDRPLTPAPYAQGAQVAYALAVLDASGTDRAGSGIGPKVARAPGISDGRCVPVTALRSGRRPRGPESSRCRPAAPAPSPPPRW